MQKRRLKAPSPAFVISLIALFVALGGTTYAATNLPKNSVGTKQLKKNAVTGKKIRKNAVTGKKIKKNSITTAKIKNGAVTAAKINPTGLTVPNALHATTANSATSATNANHATTADSATSATNANHAATADKLGGMLPSSFVNTCDNGSVVAVGSWYAPALPTDPTFVPPNRYGGEDGYSCTGATPLMAKEGTGWYRMEFSQELPYAAHYLAFVNPDARGPSPLTADANYGLVANGHSVWDIHVFDNNGAPADAYYIEVMLVRAH